MATQGALVGLQSTPLKGSPMLDGPHLGGNISVSIQHQVGLCAGPETLVNPGVRKEYFVKRQREHLQVLRESRCRKERWGGA